MQRNCLTRFHKPYASIPAHFSAFGLQNEKRLSEQPLEDLKFGVSRYRRFSEEQELGIHIPNSSANIWNVTHYKSLEIVISECKQTLHKTMCSWNRVKKNPQKEQAVRSVMNEMKPFEIDFIEYESGKHKDTALHEDAFRLFGTVVLILQDSANGRLQVKGHGYPRIFSPGGCDISRSDLFAPGDNGNPRTQSDFCRCCIVMQLTSN